MTLSVAWSGLILQTMYPVTFLVLLGKLHVHVSPAQHHFNSERITSGLEVHTQGVNRSQTSLLVRIV